MRRVLASVAIFIVLLAAIAFQCGLFDSADFHEVDAPALSVIVASASFKDFGKEFHSLLHKLLDGTREAILQAENGDKSMKDAATRYGSVDGSEALPVALYFDDPAAEGETRFAIGWAVNVEDDAAFERMHKAAAEASTLDEPIRAVHIGGTNNKALLANVPWRSGLTPMFSSSRHWNAGYDMYMNGGYVSKTDGSNDKESDQGSVALEIYFMGPQDAIETIQYVLLMGDNSRLLDEMFPVEGKSWSTDFVVADQEAMLESRAKHTMKTRDRVKHSVPKRNPRGEHTHPDPRVLTEAGSMTGAEDASGGGMGGSYDRHGNKYFQGAAAARDRLSMRDSSPVQETLPQAGRAKKVYNRDVPNIVHESDENEDEDVGSDNEPEEEIRNPKGTYNRVEVDEESDIEIPMANVDDPGYKPDINLDIGIQARDEVELASESGDAEEAQGVSVDPSSESSPSESSSSDLAEEATTTFADNSDAQGSDAEDGAQDDGAESDGSDDSQAAANEDTMSDADPEKSIDDNEAAGNEDAMADADLEKSIDDNQAAANEDTMADADLEKPSADKPSRKSIHRDYFKDGEFMSDE
mmetsp:Transcript_15844/g.43742  ORF Transcript_15844/g.43742 Transcript_15844/m.43742 type:complete len:582 (-) Transcript_15844:215-1960(-)|eukprot:CAMPEP_0198115326 /NCGR_PEP_ID=MMETSP1442-20131203/6468_1 /TAXON_ID= /ORGANISM="Craspedostauros australis, Strain CCMP3328" /LENGTH=581 /DNA_ID=CAMNT_0043772825 /DNA_START=71 /DNA_END=1816 /DNA_ORIENTATION=+